MQGVIKEGALGRRSRGAETANDRQQAVKSSARCNRRVVFSPRSLEISRARQPEWRSRLLRYYSSTLQLLLLLFSIIIVLTLPYYYSSLITLRS
jgi:hypothetical protein